MFTSQYCFIVFLLYLLIGKFLLGSIWFCFIRRAKLSFMSHPHEQCHLSVQGCIQCPAAQSWLLLASWCSFRWEVLFLPPMSEASGLLFVSHCCTFSSPSHKSSLN